MKAREIPRGAVVIGDFVRLTGDVSGQVDTLARIAHVEERTNVLRRSLEEAEDGRGEKIIVANTDLMVIVTASSNPARRVGMVKMPGSGSGGRHSSPIVHDENRLGRPG